MPRMTKETARIEMYDELKKFQEELKNDWIDRSLPKDWTGSISAFGQTQNKEKISIRLDADMLRWFRGLGPGYQGKINMVLRIYWTALISGIVRAHYDDEEVSPLFHQMILHKAELGRLEREARAREAELDQPFS